MARIMDIDTKYKIVIFSLIVIFFLVILAALVGSKIKDIFKNEGPIAIIVNEGDLVVNYIDGQEINYFDSKEHEFKITLTNNSSEKIYYSLYLNDINTSNINIKIKDYEDNVIEEFDSNKGDLQLLNLLYINVGETIRYTVTIDSSNIANFKGKLMVVNESLSNSSFDDLILLNNDVVSPVSRVGNEASTINEGLISTSDNKGTSYYFRGDVQNNYVKLGNLMFRIVRINGDSSIRLVLDGALDTLIPYNTNENENVNNLALLNESSLVNELNNWLDNNLSDYSDYIVNEDFCTDNDFSYSFNNINYSRSYERIFVDTAPDLYCNETIYTGKVGLLSIDEVVLAGAYKNIPNQKYYLYNEDINGSYVTSNSYYINQENNISIMNVLENGALGDGVLITSKVAIRPVININTEAKVKGEGTIDNPYIIVS